MDIIISWLVLRFLVLNENGADAIDEYYTHIYLFNLHNKHFIINEIISIHVSFWTLREVSCNHHGTLTIYTNSWR